MGGMGSGRRRSTHVGVVENTLAIDMRILRRLGVVRSGECVIDTLHWSQRGLNMPFVRLRIDLSDIYNGTMTISGDMTDGPVTQRIAIAAPPCRFGGHRFYFLCPTTRRPCEVLHYADGCFASRNAHGLNYTVQGLDALSRARRRAHKLRSRLDGQGALPRPRGQRRYRLVEKLHAAEREANELYADCLRKAVGGIS